MHDNAIHDLALTYWSEVVSIKRLCCQMEAGGFGKLFFYLMVRQKNRTQKNDKSNHLRSHFLRRHCHRALKIRTAMLTEPPPTRLPFRNGPSGASVQHFGTPVMGISLWGSSPLCEVGISRRSVYQMKTSREQALGEGNRVKATERGKEACNAWVSVESVDGFRFWLTSLATHHRSGNDPQSSPHESLE